MERKQFEAEVHGFCKLYIRDIVSEWHLEYNDSMIESDYCANIKFRIGRNREYNINLIPHPDDENDIAINTYEPDYLPSDAGGLYAWLWRETMRMEDEVMDSAGIMRKEDGELQAKYFVGDDWIWLNMHTWTHERRKAAKELKRKFR